MFKREPEKINPNKNSFGINFQNSEKVKNFLVKSHYKWVNSVVPGPVMGDTFVLFVDNSRVKRLVELEEQNVLINIEKNTKIKLRKIDVQISNIKQ